MTATSYSTMITVDKSPRDVFNAINNVRSWWSEEIEGNTHELHAEWNYRYQDVHRCKLKIIESIPNKRIVWLVLDNHFSFTKDKSEWTNTKIIFEISENGNQTNLQFTHEGLIPEYECYDICEGAWSTYVQQSLYSLITTGKGQPNGKDKPRTEDESRLTTSFTTTFFVNQSSSEVFQAINNVRGWWQGEIKGRSEKLNDEFEYRMYDVHYSKQRVVELTADEKIVWLVTDSTLSSFSTKTEWTGTTILFEIKEINGKTQLRFTHKGLVPAFQCYGDCSGAWEMLVQQSLLSLITTGKGKKVF